MGTENAFSLPDIREEQLSAIRAEMGEKTYQALVREAGEAELPRSFSESPATGHRRRLGGWLKMRLPWLLVSLTLVGVLAELAFLDSDPAAGQLWQRVLAGLVVGVLGGVFFTYILSLLAALVRGFMTDHMLAVVIPSAIVTVVALLTGLVFFLVPSLSHRTGFIALGIAAAALLLMVLALVYATWACCNCGSFSTEKLVKVTKLPGYAGVEHHSRRCRECGHVSASYL